MKLEQEKRGKQAAKKIGNGKEYTFYHHGNTMKLGHL